jgi:hypothetical protein
MVAAHAALAHTAQPFAASSAPALLFLATFLAPLLALAAALLLPAAASPSSSSAAASPALAALAAFGSFAGLRALGATVAGGQQQEVSSSAVDGITEECCGQHSMQQCTAAPRVHAQHSRITQRRSAPPPTICPATSNKHCSTLSSASPHSAATSPATTRALPPPPTREPVQVGLLVLCAQQGAVLPGSLGRLPDGPLQQGGLA